MDYPVESFTRRGARAARAPLHQPRPAGVRPREPAGDREGRDVRPLLALPGHAAAAVPRRVRRRRGGRRPAGGLRRRGGRARAQALRAHLPRLRRRLGGPARRRARRVRVGLERDDQGAPARAARRLPRAVHALHPLRPPIDGGPATATGATPSWGPSTSGPWTSLFDTYSRGAAARAGLGRGALPARRGRARGGPPRARSRRRRSTCCAGCCPRRRSRTWACSPPARPTSSCCCA